MPPKQSNLANAPIFKSRTRAVPLEKWHSLTVRTEGVELTEKLEDWGAEPKTSPVATILITCLERVGSIRGSRFVLRGPIFGAKATKPLPLAKVFPDQKDVTVSFSLEGSALNFSNPESRNASLWVDLRSQPTTKFHKEGEVMTSEQIDTILPGGSLLVRVALFPLSTTHLEMVLQATTLSKEEMEKKAEEWNIAMESLDFPAIDLTSHWSRYDISYHPSTQCGLVSTTSALSAGWSDSTSLCNKLSITGVIRSWSTLQGRIPARSLEWPSSPSSRSLARQH